MNAKSPAYPAVEDWADPSGIKRQIHHAGLTKRELFAAMAMQGILSANPDTRGVAKTEALNNATRIAVAVADALLTELETKH